MHDVSQCPRIVCPIGYIYIYIYIYIYTIYIYNIGIDAPIVDLHYTIICNIIYLQLI